MLLAIDIGNTNIVVGCFKGSQIVEEFRFSTYPEKTLDEYAVLLSSRLFHALGSDVSFTASIISSVVPPVTPEITRYIKETFKISPLVVEPGCKTGMPLHLKDPTGVGADRIVNAVAAREHYGKPALVIDFGTATSFDLIGAEGAYEGGVIAPGLKSSLESLVRSTSKLPRIELVWPEVVVGKNTIEAMQSGAMIGYVCLVDGLIERIISQVGEVKHIVATGGIGKSIAAKSKFITDFDSHLTLKGMFLIAELNGYGETNK